MKPPIRPSQIDARLNALYGQQILSYVTHQTRYNNLPKALFAIRKFLPLKRDRPSTMERLVLKKLALARAKIYRYEGNFSQAEEFLRTEALDEDANLDGVTGRYRTSQLAAVLCEQGDPSKAQMLLHDEISTLEKLNLSDTYGGRCLRLSLAEALLEGGSLINAKSTYCGLKELYKDLPNSSGIERLRLSVGLARISHVRFSGNEALTNWQQALMASESCGWKEGFIEMVICYSMSYVQAELGKSEKSHALMKKADELAKREDHQYWLTGLGTYWLDFVRRSIREKK
ncbi:hypothetical protein MMC13_007666 [Lambiella insularis]|nr:hypothetical protein [Lambiella insularis]